MNPASQPWFAWIVAVIVGLPLLVVVLSEVHLRLARRGNALADPVNRLRIWLIPLAALLLVLTRGAGVASENSGVRAVATLVGVIAVAVALGGLNAVLFGNATEGTWRDRLPSIFVDLARLVLVAAGAAIVASYVWGLDVGGLWATLGVGSIVIGLALQNAIGSVVAGLLLLFEQPFKIGDNLDVGGTHGRVVEMNWRSTHLDTGSGIQIIPNATIAAASFANYSRPSPAHDHVVTTLFEKSDDPQRVAATLLTVARDLPHLRPDAVPSVQVTGSGAYATTLPLATAGQNGPAESVFLTWLWYASRREEISLDGEAFIAHPAAFVEEALGLVRTTLQLTDDEIKALADSCEVETFGQGETILREGNVPRRYAFIVSGLVQLSAATSDGASLAVVELDVGDALGASALLGSPGIMTSTATTNVDLLQIPTTSIDQLVASKPGVARTLNRLVTTRERQRRQAFESINASHELASRLHPASAALRAVP